MGTSRRLVACALVAFAHGLRPCARPGARRAPRHQRAAPEAHGFDDDDRRWLLDAGHDAAALGPEDVVAACMLALQHNDEPLRDAGLRTCWALSSDMCRSAVGGSLDAFLEYARNPTFGALVGCASWSVASCKRVAGSATRGAMATQVVRVQPASRGASARHVDDDGDEPGPSAAAPPREFLWTLQQERRPPRAGEWLVYECLAMSNAIAKTL